MFKGEFTEQAVFDHVVVALAQQGGRSMTRYAKDDPYGRDDICAYRGENGRKCAVGLFLTDEEVDHIGNNSAFGLNAAPERLKPVTGLLLELQSCHDGASEENGKFRNVWGIEGVAYGLWEIAVSHGLSTAVLYAAFPHPDAPEQKPRVGDTNPRVIVADATWWNSFAPGS